MKETIRERLATLRAEHKTGQKMLADLDARRAGLTQTLLRLEGAIVALQELEGLPATPLNGVHAAQPSDPTPGSG